MSPFTTIAFDLDGTLVDSVPDLTAAVDSMLIELSKPPAGNEKVRDWVGNGVEVLVQRALSGQTEICPLLSGDQVSQAQRLFDKYYRQYSGSYSQLYPGVRETLVSLKHAGFRLLVITNKRAEFTHPVLTGFDLADLFDMVICGDTLANKKPAPDQLLHAMEQWQLPPEQLLMVGDSRNDVGAARASGVAICALTYGYNHGEDIRLSEPDWVMDHFTQLASLLTVTENNHTN